MKKQCKHCKEFFETKDEKRKFCSQKCFRIYRKGLTYEEMYGEEKSKQIRKKQSNKSKELETWKKGKPFEKEHNINKGKIPWNKDKKGSQVAWNKDLIMKNYYDEEQYKKFIEGCIKGGVRCCLNVADRNKRTKIELKIEEVLKEINIKFFIQYPLLGICVVDFYLPDNHLIIEADGDYWHNYPHGTQKDHIRDKELINNHYSVLRFWERDINNNIEEVKKEILRKLQRL